VQLQGGGTYNAPSDTIVEIKEIASQQEGHFFSMEWTKGEMGGIIPLPPVPGLNHCSCAHALL